jgi:3D (Asp-Asp-Asp) domain-containing protein
VSAFLTLTDSLKQLSLDFNALTVLVLARLPLKTTGALFIFSAVGVISFNPFYQKDAISLGESLVKSGVVTEILFEEIQTISFSQTRIPDSQLPLGEEKIVQEGKNGEIKKVMRSLSFQGRVFTNDVIKKVTTPAQNKIIAFGTQKTYFPLETSKGQVYYWSKLRMYSTSYDSRCPGCNEITATGLKTGFGVVAVDPKVIPLKTRLYIPGYGFAVAGDTGGAVKGNKIDLGFDDVKKGWWSARYTDVYLLSEN